MGQPRLDSVEVGTTATELITLSNGNYLLIQVPDDAAVSVFIGDSTVTATKTGGIEVKPGGDFNGDQFNPGGKLYGIVASGTVTVPVLYEG